MTLSPQRLEKAADEIERLFKNPSAVSLEEIARAVVSAYLGDTHVDVPKSGDGSVEFAVANEREACAQICDHWIGTFQGVDIKYTSAREYAVDAIEDIADVIRKPELRAMLSASLTERGAE